MTHYAPLIAALTTLLVLTVILTVGKRAVVHDIPNERSLHNKPVPRVGGVALLGIGMTAQRQVCLLPGWFGVYGASSAWLDRNWRQHQTRQENIDVA